MQTAGQIYRQALKRHWLAYTLGTITVLVTSVTEVAVPKFIQWGLDTVAGKGSVPDFLARDSASETLRTLSQWMLGVLLVGFVGRILWRQLLARRTHLAGRDLKVRFWDSLRFLPLHYFHKYPLGDLMNRAAGDWNPARAIHGFTIVLTLDVVFFTILALAAMLTIDVELTIYCLAVFPLLPRLIMKLAKREHDLHLEAQAQLGTLTDGVSQAISSVRLARATASDKAWSESLGLKAREYARRRFQVVRTGWLIFPLGAIPTLIAYGMLLVWGVRKIGAGEISVGQFVAMQSYVLMLQGPLFDLGDVISEWQKGLASLSRIAEIFNLAPLGARFTAEGRRPSGTAPALAVDALTYTYEGGNEPVLRGVSLAVPRGRAVGLHGPIGAGKSTLLKLAAGLADAPAGKVRLFGEDAGAVDRRWLAEHVVTVPQRAFLFAGSIRQNLLLGDDYPEAALWDALEAVQLASDVRGFAEGLDTWIGEWGVTLSGGQKQRLSLARALLRKRDIYLLDDCLSAVDAATEEKILAGLRGRLKDAAVVWVAHRTSTLRFCDELYELEGGVLGPAAKPRAAGPSTAAASGTAAQASSSRERREEAVDATGK